MHATSAAISTHDFGRCYIFRAIPKNMIVARTPALETFICDKRIAMFVHFLFVSLMGVMYEST